MKLTKEDLMRLPKERLAELLVEMQEPLTLTSPMKSPDITPSDYCFYVDGSCTNSHLCSVCPYKKITVTYDNANTISSAKS